MKCISLWQPWATLWCSGIKIHETRHWSTNVRGRVLVHAAKRPIDRETRELFLVICDEFPDAFEQIGFDIDSLDFGALVGQVEIAECVPTEKVFPPLVFEFERRSIDYYLGNFEQGRYAWRAENPVLFDTPLPTRGQQGFWEVAI